MSRATNNGTGIALDWTELAKVGSAFYNDRTYLFSPHGAGLLDGQAWCVTQAALAPG